jgi:hypothetical protein
MNEGTMVPVETPTAMVLPDIQALQRQRDAAVEGSGDGVFGQRLSFLPYVQLFTGNSQAVQKAKITPGHYGIVRNKEITPIGPVLLCIPLAWRAVARNMNGDKPMSYYDPRSEKFQQIKTRSDADSNSGNMYGPEFVCWSPDHGFFTFMFGSKSARNEAPAMKALLPGGGAPRVAALGAQYIEGKEHSWWSPQVKLSSQSLSGLPIGELEQVVTDFLNPTDSKEDEVAPTEAVKTDR